MRLTAERSGCLIRGEIFRRHGKAIVENAKMKESLGDVAKILEGCGRQWKDRIVWREVGGSIA